MVDIVRTRQAYAHMRVAGQMRCDCAYCRNFFGQLPELLPSPILNFFAQAEIDVQMPSEVYELQKLEYGRNLYGGEYYFFGSANWIDINSLEAAYGMHISLHPPSPITPDAFRSHGAVCLEFQLPVPWVLAHSV